MQCLLVMAGLAGVSVCQSEEWRRVAFLGNAKVKSISGFVEVIAPEGRVLKEGETARVGDTLRIWRGSDLIIEMENSKSLVRAKGPVILRLAPESEGQERAAIDKERAGYVVRAVRGGGRYSEDGIRWGDLRTGMVLAEGSQVRPFRDSVIDLYHNRTHNALRLMDHKKAVVLGKSSDKAQRNDLLAAKGP